MSWPQGSFKYLFFIKETKAPAGLRSDIWRRFQGLTGGRILTHHSPVTLLSPPAIPPQPSPTHLLHSSQFGSQVLPGTRPRGDQLSAGQHM